jgi:surface polysaccharide O-acyltransferase-like enzyme
MKKRMFWADALRTLSIFMVVVIHASAQVMYEWSGVATGELSVFAWNFANLLNSFSRISVPLFVMLSGAFLLKKQESLQKFLSKRLPKIIWPWIFWGTIQLFYNYNYYLGKITLTEFFGVFWFMPMILGLYLITPIIKPFIKSATQKEFKYFYILWFITVSVIPTLNQTFGKNISLSLPSFIQYLGYFIAGYYIVHIFKVSKIIEKQIQLLFFVSIFVIFSGTYALTRLDSEFHISLYEYINVPVLIASITGFITLKSFFINKTKNISKKLQLKITRISQSTLGIFLSHALILDILTTGKLGIIVHSLIVTPFFALPVTIFLVFSLSTLLVMGIKDWHRFLLTR